MFRELSNRHRTILEFLTIFLLFALINMGSQVFQKRVSNNDGMGWDGQGYYEIAEQFSKGQVPHVRKPLAYRIGVPFLVSLGPTDDILLNFKIVNIIANFLTVFFLMVWLKLYLKSSVLRIVLVTLFMIQYLGPVRFTYYYPALVDPWAFPFLSAGLILIHYLRRKPTVLMVVLLGVLCLVGVSCREIVGLLGITLLFVTNPLKPHAEGLLPVKIVNRPPVAFFIPLLCGIVSSILIKQYVIETGDYSFFLTAAGWVWRRPLMPFIHSWFLGYGPVLFIAIYNWRKLAAFLKENQHLLAYLAGIVVLSWVGGGDNERFSIWAMPIIYLLIGKSIEDNLPVLKSWALIIVITCAQLIAHRAIWTIPDSPSEASSSIPLFTPIGSNVPYHDLYSLPGNRIVEAASMMQYLVFGAIVLFWLRCRAIRASRRSASSPSLGAGDG